MKNKKCYFCGALLNENSEFCPNCGKNVKNLNNVLFGNIKSSVENPEASNTNKDINSNQFSSINSGSTEDDHLGNQSSKKSFSLSVGLFLLTVVIMFIITDIIAFTVGYLLYGTDINPIYKTGDLSPRLANTSIYNQALGEVYKYHFMLWSILLIFSVIQIILFQYLYRLRRVSKEKIGSYIYTISYFIIPALNITILISFLLFFNQIIVIDHYLIKVMAMIGIGIGALHLMYRFLATGTGGRSDSSDVSNAI